MALHDFVCSACGFILRDYNVPAEIGAVRGAPTCPEGCAPLDQPLGVQMDWIPQIGRMDAYKPFQEFETTDCYGKPRLVESMTQIREIEEESEREYRDGPRDDSGNPLAQKQVWRDYSQDKSNQDVHSFATHLDRDMTMQEGPRIEASLESGRAISESEAEQRAGKEKDLAFSGGDVLGDGGS